MEESSSLVRSVFVLCLVSSSVFCLDDSDQNAAASSSSAVCCCLFLERLRTFGLILFFSFHLYENQNQNQNQNHRMDQSVSGIYRTMDARLSWLFIQRLLSPHRPGLVVAVAAVSVVDQLLRPEVLVVDLVIDSLLVP